MKRRQKSRIQNRQEKMKKPNIIKDIINRHDLLIKMLKYVFLRFVSHDFFSLGMEKQKNVLENHSSSNNKMPH